MKSNGRSTTLMNPVEDLKHISHLLKPNPMIYWTDLLTTFAIHQFFFWSCVFGSSPLPIKIICAFISGIAAHRSVYMNHEIMHAARSLPHLEMAYNLLFGYWTKFTTFIHEPHKYHHAKHTFGTTADPEYAAIQGKLVPMFVAPMIIAALVPFLFFIRFGLVPLALPFLGENGRLFVYRYLSTVGMQPKYKRPDPTPEEKRKWYSYGHR